jgi:hypothetical protein
MAKVCNTMAKICDTTAKGGPAAANPGLEIRPYKAAKPAQGAVEKH